MRAKEDLISSAHVANVGSFNFAHALAHTIDSSTFLLTNTFTDFAVTQGSAKRRGNWLLRLIGPFSGTGRDCRKAINVSHPEEGLNYQRTRCLFD
jgi:hypothetical protein